MNCKNSAQNALKVAIFRKKNVLGKGNAPSPDPSPIGEGTPFPQTPLPSAPSAPQYSRLRRSATRRLDPRVFGARPFPPLANPGSATDYIFIVRRYKLVASSVG